MTKTKSSAASMVHRKRKDGSRAARSATSKIFHYKRKVTRNGGEISLKGLPKGSYHIHVEPDLVPTSGGTPDFKARYSLAGRGQVKRISEAEKEEILGFAKGR